VALPDDFDEAHRVHRTIMYYDGAREHAPRQALHRRVMSAVLNAAIDEGLAISHDDYRGALAKRAALAELALDLFENCDRARIASGPGRSPRRGSMPPGDPSFCTLWTLARIPRSYDFRLAFRRAACPTGCSSPAPRAATTGCCASQAGARP